ncbi:Endo-1,3(4)-beta-glucanase 2, partial [Frankliniella fusca]
SRPAPSRRYVAAAAATVPERARGAVVVSWAAASSSSYPPARRPRARASPAALYTRRGPVCCYPIPARRRPGRSGDCGDSQRAVPPRDNVQPRAQTEPNRATVTSRHRGPNLQSPAADNAAALTASSPAAPAVDRPVGRRRRHGADGRVAGRRTGAGRPGVESSDAVGRRYTVGRSARVSGSDAVGRRGGVLQVNWVE